MPKLLRARPPRDAVEERQIRKLASSRHAPGDGIRRAQMIGRSWDGPRTATIAAALGCHPQTVRERLGRFNAEGLDGLRDRPRSGRPATYTPEQVGAVVEASLTSPEALGLPFASWTLDRLAAYLQEGKGIPIKRTRIDEILGAEGLRWRTQETWFGERVDPAFAEKRGPSSRSTRPRLRIV